MGITSLLLILVNVLVSYKGFNDDIFFDKYKFQVDKILLYKDYKRLITSGFLHVGWMHLLFNVFTLYALGAGIESYLGGIRFLIVYFISLLGGELLSLFVHRNHGDYSSVGASGSICGIIFASIALFPGMSISLFGLLAIPGWLYGIIFILFSMYGIQSKKNNIGHEVHLGGALVGMAVALLMEPSALMANYITILVITVPSLVFIWLIITRPQLLFVDNFFFKKHTDFYSIDHKYNKEKSDRQEEIDRILDKISSKGMKSLSSEEKNKLKEYSKKSF